MNLAQLTKLTEDQSRQYLESIRWPEGPVCPHCQGKVSAKLQGKSTSPGYYKCKMPACRKKFSVTVGTIFERSHIRLRDWLIAFHLMVSSKKGASAHQIHRSVGVTYKTAWFMCHRIRHAMEQGAGFLKGTVEADETYVGGKPRKGEGIKGRGTKKTPVAALVQRGGEVRAQVMPRVNAKNLRRFAQKHCSPATHLMTDEYNAYKPVGRDFLSHGVVNHSAGEYVSGPNHNNTAESFFALLKRGHYGTFHHFSKHHLQRYVNEFQFRWNNRKVNDGLRREAALRGAEGKRLTYR